MDNPIKEMSEDSIIDLSSELENSEDVNEKISQNQFYDIVVSRKPDWQAIIYELIHTEQLDPWDIDILVLTEKYFEKVLQIEQELENEDIDETDFYASSKVLLAAAFLLRIKSEFLLNKHIKSVDEILFGKKEDKKYIVERIQIDEEDLPVLIPKTPLPRSRRVTLSELMTALNKAINTESRRIKREVSIKRAQKLSEIDFPQFKRIDLKDRIKHFYSRVLTSIKRKSTGPDKDMNKIGYSDLIGKEREEKLASFLPLLHLSNTKKLWLEQEKHLDEIWVYLYTYFSKNPNDFLEELEEDIEEMKEELSGAEDSEDENIEQTPLELARLKKEEKKRLEEEMKTELEKELNIEIIKGREIDTRSENDVKKIAAEIGEVIQNIDKSENIEEITGFEDELI